MLRARSQLNWHSAGGVTRMDKDGWGGVAQLAARRLGRRKDVCIRALLLRPCRWRLPVPFVGRGRSVGLVEPSDSGPSRVSYERVAVDAAIAELEPITGIKIFRGQGGSNRFSVPGWTTASNQAFQFGDLRVDSPRTTVVVEYESAAGVTNLVKYWPLLRSEQRPTKRFVIVHVFQVASPGDYLSHRLLWDFVVERMTADLLARGLQRPLQWEARSFTYRRGETASDAIEFIRTNL